MKLREYQSEAVQAVFDQLESSDSTLIVKATGLGKTVTFSEIVRRWPGGAIILAHREELITQACHHLRSVGVGATIEMGQERARWDDVDARRPVIVSSVQTLSRPRRQKRLHREMRGLGITIPTLMVIDEAHHATASTYGACIQWHREIAGKDWRLVGVTATPNRADKEALGQVFDSVAYRYEIADAIHDGWLVPIEPHAIVVEDLDFSTVSATAGDLNESQLEQILTEERHLHDVAVPTVELAGNRSTLVFCVTVRHAECLAEVLNRYYRDRGILGPTGQPARAVALSGATDKENRKLVIDQYRSGDISTICNCALFLEGFDAPNTAVVVMARPTKSLALYTQVVGRGTRPLKGVVDGPETAEARRAAIAASAKPKMLLLDFVGNTGEHKLCSSVDVLGGKYSEEVREYAARTIQEEGHATDAQDALARADAELALLKEEDERRAREDERRARIVAQQSSYRTQVVNPFAESGPVEANGPVDVGPAHLATNKQVNYLQYLGRRLGRRWNRYELERMSKRQAGKLIDESLRKLSSV